MRSLFLAGTALALFATPAQSATLITYNLSGTAWFEYVVPNGPVYKLQNATASLSLVEEAPYCAAPYTCGAEGLSVYLSAASSGLPDWTSVFLGFNTPLVDGEFPTDASLFNGASVFYVNQTNKIFSSSGVSWTLDSITEQTVADGDFSGVNSTVTLGSVIRVLPEPATWAMMIGGFALAGAALRRRAVAVAFT